MSDLQLKHILGPDGGTSCLDLYGLKRAGQEDFEFIRQTYEGGFTYCPVTVVDLL